MSLMKRYRRNRKEEIIERLIDIEGINMKADLTNVFDTLLPSSRLRGCTLSIIVSHSLHCCRCHANGGGYTFTQNSCF